MQMQLDLDGRPDFLRTVDTKLRDHFGPSRDIYLRLDPVSQLVMSLLGGRTRSAVSKAAFIDLLSRYGDWRGVRDASLDEIRSCLGEVTYGERKAVYLRATLQRISRPDGWPSLKHLDELTTAQALCFLETLPGVGPKVAAAVVNFSVMQRRSLVVDTHHLRVAARLGLVRGNAGFSEARDSLMALVPDDWSAGHIDRHHGRVKGLGQTLCRPFERYCRDCPLESVCPGSRDPGARHGRPGRAPRRGQPARLRRSERALLAHLQAQERT